MILKYIFNKISQTWKAKKDIYLIDSDEAQFFVKESLSNEYILGLDTEFDWRTTYFPTLSLLQISMSDKIFLVDCIKCKKLAYLKDILEDQKRLVVFHSSRSDTTVLSTNLNIKIENTFDIQLAEKNIHGGEIKNYGSIVKNYLGIKLDKSETNSNWLKRPLTEKQLTYAADDVDFLIDIHFKQLKILTKLNLTDKTYNDSKKESDYGNQELFVTRLKKLKKASKEEKDIFLWREGYASKLNIPPSHIFKDKNLRMLAEETKNETTDLSNISKFFKKDKYVSDFLNDMNL